MGPKDLAAIQNRVAACVPYGKRGVKWDVPEQVDISIWRFYYRRRLENFCLPVESVYDIGNGVEDLKQMCIIRNRQRYFIPKHTKCVQRIFHHGVHAKRNSMEAERSRQSE
jgi:hypothetical protein